jgi:predicted DNA-binding helix-hairpin-helix protein
MLKLLYYSEHLLRYFMEILQKLEILAGAAKYDVSCSSSGGSRTTQRGGFGNS